MAGYPKVRIAGLVLVSLLVFGCRRGERPAVWDLTPNVSFHEGPVNGLLIRQGSETVAIYRDPRPEGGARQVLFTHHRRDVVSAGRAAVGKGAGAVVPAEERALFAEAEQFWKDFETARWDDYAQQSTKVLTRSIPVAQTVRDGQTLHWNNIAFEVMATPGYTRGAVSYLFTIDGKRIAAVGDLIYGDGQLFDIYSLQDAIPEANVRGYHGYAARAAFHLKSLRKLREWNADYLVPARGPVVENPREAIDKLIGRLEAVFVAYFKTDALRWYWGDDNLRIRVQRVLGNREIPWMPMATSIRQTLPRWILPNGTSRLLISDSGGAFLLDCGTAKAVEWIRDLKRQGRFQKLEGIFITHFHDDHTDFVQRLREEHNVPVFAATEVKDILENPGAYHMPAVSPNAIRPVEAMAEGTTMRWYEFKFHFTYFPGQALYHGGLMVERDGGEKFLFLGDSFSPSGLDDYCLQNRHFLHENLGHYLCLNKIEAAGPQYNLINQHIEPTFRYGPEQIAFMRKTLDEKRSALLALAPWDDPNYATDEQWSRFYPYSRICPAGQGCELQVVFFNHSPARQKFTAKLNLPEGWRAEPSNGTSEIEPRREGMVQFRVTPPVGASGLTVLTADIETQGRTLPEWTEAMLTVQ